VTLGSAAQTLPPVFFNNLSAGGAGIVITFQVNLKVQTELGRFNPATDSVVCAGTFDNWSTSELTLEKSATDTKVYVGRYTDVNVVAGAFNNWSTTASPLTRSTKNPSIYSGTFNDTKDAPGNPGQFKFVINGNTWESINNRVFTVADSAQTLDPLFFNNIDNL